VFGFELPPSFRELPEGIAVFFANELWNSGSPPKLFFTWKAEKFKKLASVSF
jgi:hypothetical protein